MNAEFYLDTARLGRMCPGARKAEQAYSKLASQLGSSLYLERFLAHGFETLPRRYQKRLAALKCWRGIDGFADLFRRYLNAPNDAPVHFFGQSSSMIDFAARAIFSVCRNVFVTDLCWPPYLRELQRIAHSQGRSVVVVPIFNLINDGISVEQLTAALINQFSVNRCDGLFVSDISFHGYRLPVARLISTLKPVFSIVDGAQAIGQRPVDVSSLDCDLYLAGSQKWLGSYYPLRVSVVGRTSVHPKFNRFSEEVSSWSQDDLLRFSQQLQNSSFPSFGETVNVVPLLSAAGALVTSLRQRTTVVSWKTVTDNALTARDWLESERWKANRSDRAFVSGIVQLLPRSDERLAAQELRASMMRQSILATAYDDRTIRFSMPQWPLSLQQLSKISRVLEQLEN